MTTHGKWSMSPAASISPHFELSAVPKFVAAHKMWPLFCSSDFICKASSGGLDEGQIPRRSLKKRTRNGTDRLPLNNKRVTFDDSSVDRPSNAGARSFDYTGITFADVRREEVPIK